MNLIQGNYLKIRFFLLYRVRIHRKFLLFKCILECKKGMIWFVPCNKNMPLIPLN